MFLIVFFVIAIVYLFGLGGPYGSDVLVVYVQVLQLCFNVNALGPTPTGVTVSPSGCQSLQVTWTHHAPTPLTLNHYRVLYKSQGGYSQSSTNSSEGSYTITGLAPATTYIVAVDAQTQLGYGYFCCTPNATTHNGEASSAAHGSLLHIVFVPCYRTCIQHACHACCICICISIRSALYIILL